MRYGKPVVIGKRIKLDFSRVSHDVFEKRRIEYHRVLQEAFFEQFQITGSDEHKIKRGESVWVLAKRKYKVPIWLLRQYNPDLSFEKIRPGMIIKFPRVEERQDLETDPQQQEAEPNTTAAIPFTAPLFAYSTAGDCVFPCLSSLLAYAPASSYPAKLTSSK